MGAAATSRSEFVPRGVWKGPHPRDGAPTAIAVDSEKRCLGEIVLHAGVDTAKVRTFLWELVNAVDPVPDLALVREAPNESERLKHWPKREPDPTGLSPAATLLLYRRP